jgi:hypothetical protein
MRGISSPKATLTASDHVSLTHGAQGDLYAVAETGVVRESMDGGVSWSATGTLSQVHMSAMVMGEPGTLFAATPSLSRESPCPAQDSPL